MIAMQNFLTPPDAFTEDRVVLEGDEYFHATRSCRVRSGEIIGVTDGVGRRVEARIGTIDSRRLEAVIMRDVSGEGELAVHVSLALALIKPDRFETAVEKCTELGVRRILPFIAERSTVKAARIRTGRLENIARSAVKQAGRSWMPEIRDPAPLGGLLEETADGTMLAAFTGTAGAPGLTVAGMTSAGPLTLLVGPEGGFTEGERALLMENGALPVGLGGLTLRAETAAVAGMALLAERLRTNEEHRENA